MLQVFTYQGQQSNSHFCRLASGYKTWNLWGYIHTIQALLLTFSRTGKRNIVNLSSIGGEVPVPC